MITETIKNKNSLSLGKLFGVWLSSGILVVLFSLIYIRITGLPIEAVAHNEVIRLIQGGTLTLAAAWALSILGISIKSIYSNFNASSKASLKLTAKYFLIYALVAGALIGVLSLAAMIFMKLGFFTMDSFNQHYAKSMAEKLAQKNYLRDVLIGSPVKFAIYLFSTCVLIPIEEEILTRRLLYVSLRHKMSFAASLIISSLVFGLEHLGAAAIPAIIFGMFLGWIYEKHQSLSVNIMVHGLINFSVTLTMIFYSL